MKLRITKEIKAFSTTLWITNYGKELIKNYRELTKLLRYFNLRDLEGEIQDYQSQQIEDAINLSIYVDENIIFLDKPNLESKIINGWIEILGNINTEKEGKELIELMVRHKLLIRKK